MVTEEEGEEGEEERQRIEIIYVVAGICNHGRGGGFPPAIHKNRGGRIKVCYCELEGEDKFISVMSIQSNKVMFRL